MSILAGGIRQSERHERSKDMMIFLKCLVPRTTRENRIEFRFENMMRASAQNTHYVFSKRETDVTTNINS